MNWDKTYLFRVTKEEIKDQELLDLMKLLLTYESKLEKPEYLRLDLNYIRSIYYKDYDSDLDFTIVNKERRTELGLFGVGFKFGRLFPLDIIYSDEFVTCENMKEFKEKLDWLFENDFPETEFLDDDNDDNDE